MQVNNNGSYTQRHLLSSSTSSTFPYFHFNIAQRALTFSPMALALALIAAVRRSALLIGAGMVLLSLLLFVVAVVAGCRSKDGT